MICFYKFYPFYFPNSGKWKKSNFGGKSSDVVPHILPIQYLFDAQLFCLLYFSSIGCLLVPPYLNVNL